MVDVQASFGQRPPGLVCTVMMNTRSWMLPLMTCCHDARWYAKWRLRSILWTHVRECIRALLHATFFTLAQTLTRPWPNKIVLHANMKSLPDRSTTRVSTYYKYHCATIRIIRNVWTRALRSSEENKIWSTCHDIYLTCRCRSALTTAKAQ